MFVSSVIPALVQQLVCIDCSCFLAFLSFFCLWPRNRSVVLDQMSSFLKSTQGSCTWRRFDNNGTPSWHCRQNAFSPLDQRRWVQHHRRGISCSQAVRRILKCVLRCLGQIRSLQSLLTHKLKHFKTLCTVWLLSAKSFAASFNCCSFKNLLFLNVLLHLLFTQPRGRG